MEDTTVYLTTYKMPSNNIPELLDNISDYPSGQDKRRERRKEERKNKKKNKRISSKRMELNVASKYQHLFETWFDNLTPNQILYYQAYSNGQKSPFTI